MAREVLDNVTPGEDSLFTMANKVNANFTEVYSGTRNSYGLSPSNTALQNRNAWVALSNTNYDVYLPPGDYNFDNNYSTVADVRLSNFTGTVTFARGARFIFNTNTKVGTEILNGGPFKITGWRSTFSTLPPSRVASMECVPNYNVTKPHWEDVEMIGSAAAGLLFNNCIQPTVNRARIYNTMADGVAFYNSSDSKGVDILTDTTGDDGVSVVNVAAQPDKNGADLTNIRCYNSSSRGIVVVGTSDVVITNFYTKNTKNSGIICTTEYGNPTRVPSRVLFQSGIVVDPGRLGTDGAQRHGAHIENIGERVQFKDVDIYNAPVRGIQISGNTETRKAIKISGLRIFDAGNVGVYTEQQVDTSIEDVEVYRSGSYGFYTASSTFIRLKNIKAIECATTDALRRVIWFHENTRIECDDWYIIDTQATPTGYIIGTFHASGTPTGFLGNGHYLIPNGGLSVSNSSNLNIGDINGTPSSRSESQTASVTLDRNSAHIQRYASAVNSALTVTLPTGNESWVGRQIEVARLAAGTGTLAVGSVKTIPANTNGWVKVRMNGSGTWDLVGYSQWT